jgi:predicted AAA+ superfamily ATPase
MNKIYFNRTIDKDLQACSKEADHKPVLLGGARQVGKSSPVRKLAEQFENYLEINFEQNKRVHAFFDSDLVPQQICDHLSIHFNQVITAGKTLLFFDEIQACPRAISALRFFYEDYPELHVIAAGSLLEFALEELPSFGVGRISSMYMYPFSFSEFISACGEERLWNTICQASPEQPLHPVFHEKALEILKQFLVIGGMPAVVARFVERRDILACQKTLNDLINSLKTDFVKYKNRASELRISAAFEAVVHQSGGKFNYAKVEHHTGRQIRESIALLQKAGLIIPVTHSSANGIPLGAQVNTKVQKFILLDTGIFQRLLGLQLSDVLLSDDFSMVNKGCIAEQMVGLELLKARSCYEQTQLYHWRREALNSQAEVDYVIQQGEKIVPIEVKSGKIGKMQSLHLFMKEKQSEYGIRTSLENFGQYDKIKVFPLYAIEICQKVNLT